jgi:phage recombination protein Bet
METLKDCVDAFREKIAGMDVSILVDGPTEEGRYNLVIDGDKASVGEDGSIVSGSEHLLKSLTKHFAPFQKAYAKAHPPNQGPDELPTENPGAIDPEDHVPDEPFQPAKEATEVQAPKAPESKVQGAKRASEPRKATALSHRADSRALQIDNLTLEDIKADFQTDPPLTDQEAKKFVMMCVAKKLNPYLGEVYIVKYRSEKGPSRASIIVGKDAFMRKADEHPKYKGMKAGIVVQKDGELVERVGTLYMDDESLIGGWCEVYRTDREEPTKSVVSLREYDTKRKMWNTMKATMIRKCAIMGAIRECFASDFTGMYDESEMAQAFDSGKEILC